MHSFNSLKKNLKKNSDQLPKISLAVTADSASQLLVQAIKGYGWEAGVNFEIHEAAYNQTDQQLLLSGSELYRSAPQYIFINYATEHLLNSFYRSSDIDKSSFAEDFILKITGYADAVAANTQARIIISTLPEINDSVFGNYAAKTQLSFIYQLRKINYLLMELAQSHTNLFLLDIALLQATTGRQFAFDPRNYYSSDMVYSLDFLPYIAKNVTDIILGLQGRFKKCVVLDLDNTLWGGIIGDDGLENIQIGNLGNGKVFTDLQLWFLQLKQRGVLLAVCSKNTGHIAKEPFTHHPDMVLRLDDFAIFIANWNNKADNIKDIQTTLNIGMDALVFIDDNPFERELVRSMIPDLSVPELPEDPAEYLIYLRSLNLFETASFTADDEARTQQYQTEAKRNQHAQTFSSEAEYLESLDMVAQISPFNTANIPRVTQLIQRSNQFNLRTVRYSETQIAELSSNPDYHTLTISLKDKFGDYGLVAVVILKKLSPLKLFIDSWIMSCRVLSRGMETFTLNAIIDYALTQNITAITGEYIPTKKNGIVERLYSNLNFTPVDDTWQLDLTNYHPSPTFIKNETAHDSR